MDTTFSTIVSLLPYDLVEAKPGLYPSEYTIKRAEDGKFSLTIIPNNVYYLINPDPLSDAKEVRNIKVPVISIEVAESIINDYIFALLASSPPTAQPGLFAVRGDYTDRKEVAIKFMKELTVARDQQHQWCQNLVDIADDTWSKTQSPVSISSLERFACRYLNYQRAWLSPLPAEVQDKCPVCKSIINQGALKCIACGHILNKSEYDKVLAGTK